MIELKKVTKTFQGIKAVDQVSASIQKGMIFGLVGSNGAGKSTLLRLIAGILKPDEGGITLDGAPVYEHPEVKKDLCFLPDAAGYPTNASVSSLCRFYQIAYPGFDTAFFYKLTDQFHLSPSQKLQTLSKGKKKQVSLLLGICCGATYLLCDETFDGLDPVMRQAVKSLFASELLKRELTPVIASHNLRELEDICDCVGLIHEGKLLFTRDLDTMKCNIHKMHCVIKDPSREQALLSELSILQYEKRGSLLTVTARGQREEIMAKVQEKDPLFAEILPLSLEEIFISETEVAGYDIKNFIQ